mgnify:CR=1 FL=1
MFRENNPNIPYTTKEIADSSIEAAGAGATVVHLHVREADGKGRETEVPLDTWFDVAIFPDSKQELLALTPLYQAHHRLRGGKQRLVVRVRQKPGAAGVDPFHLMIDRTPDDNIQRLRN